MEITLQTLLKGKPTVINDVEYQAIQDYVQPFLQQVTPLTKDFVVHVELPKQMTLSNSEKDLAFNKVWIQAILPDNGIEDYVETLNMVISLDVRVPVYKIYRAYRHKKSGNTAVFNTEWCFAKEITQGETWQYPIKDLLAMTNEVPLKLKKLQNTFINHKDLQNTLGKYIDNTLQLTYQGVGGKVKLTTNDIIRAYTEVCYKPTSSYYVSSSVEGSEHNLYSAICSQVTKSKDIVNRFEKTILIGTLFDVVNGEVDN